MAQPRTISAETADLAANWLGGMALAFEQAHFADRYVHDQAEVNAATLRSLVEAINGAGWADADPAGGVIEAQTQILLAIGHGEVPPDYSS